MYACNKHLLSLCDLGKIIHFHLNQLFQTIFEHCIYQRKCNILFFTFFKKMCHGVIFTLITFPLIAWIFFTWMKDKCFEKHKNSWLYLCKPWEAWVLLAFFQLLVLSLLFLSAVFWLELLCFCWTSVHLGTQDGMKLWLQCFQVRAWISLWNSHVQLWGIQHEYCDSCYSTCQIKMSCLSWCCINTLWHCAALK